MKKINWYSLAIKTINTKFRAKNYTLGLLQFCICGGKETALLQSDFAQPLFIPNSDLMNFVVAR
jgi:hypothetical protein